MIAALRDHTWDEVGHIYLVDDQAALVGQVRSSDCSRRRNRPAWPNSKAPFQSKSSLEMRQRQSRFARLNVMTRMAVIDSRRRLLGAIPIGRLLALLHEEHGQLLADGRCEPNRSSPSVTSPCNRRSTPCARLPWLMVGLGGGFLASGVASAYETSLKNEVASRSFFPWSCMADAVGTQTETILVRRLAYGEVSLWEQLARESVIGAFIGAIVAIVASGGLWLWNGHPALAMVVGTSLGVTAVVATIMASLLPMGLARLGADPALASGPVATVVQDILSVGIYLMIATALLPM